MRRDWSLTGLFVVRHAGLPFDWLEDLGADTDLVAAADRFLDLEADLLAHRGAQRPAVRDAILAGRAEQVSTKGDERWRTALSAWRAALADYAAAHRRADDRATEALRAALDRTEVREAVLLSNPDAYHNMLVPFLAHDGPLNARRRRVRRQLYTYLQRFCAKNETTSFFGPMAYATTGPGDGLTVLDSGRRRSAVFLSDWAIRAVRRAIISDRRVLADLTFARTGTGGRGTETTPTTDPGDREAVTRALDREPCRLRDLARRADLPLRTTAKAVRDLMATGAVDARLGGDPYDPKPLATLAGQLRELPDTAARQHWLDHLDHLEQLRRAVESASFDQRVTLIPELERAFTDATGVAARRSAGRTYADRAVFFEECASPFSLVVGERLLREWERRLAPALEICVAHGAATQRSATDRVLDAWRPPGPRTLAEYATDTATAFAPQGSVFQAGHAPRYSAEHGPTETARLARDAEDRPGDRYAVIDLCLPAPDPAAAGRATPILARTHHHLQVDGWLATMHPDRAAFQADAVEWIDARKGELVGFDFGRRNKGYYRFPGPRVALRPTTWLDADDPDVLRPEDLTVERGAEEVRLLDASGRRLRAYLPLSDFVKFPPYAALSDPQVVHPVFTGADTGVPEEVPEVRLGEVVGQRRRWLLAPGELSADRPDTRFLALRRLARRTGRRFVFLRTTTERKPYLVDLSAPLAADLAAHVDGDSGAVVEEMTPGPDQLWLRDSQGRRYTCEFRVQAIGRDRRELP